MAATADLVELEQQSGPLVEPLAALDMIQPAAAPLSLIQNLDPPLVGGPLPPRDKLDLGPVQAMLVQVAASLHSKLVVALRDLHNTRIKLADEMLKTAAALSALGEVKLSGRMDTASEEQHHSVVATIADIHTYRDVAVSALTAQAAVMANPDPAPTPSSTHDFCSVSDSLDSMFQQMKRAMEEISASGKRLQSCDNLNTSVARFSGAACGQIDTLERTYVMDKLRQLNKSSCSVQSRKPVRSLGHTLDLQDIMLVAKNAKSHVYEISLHLLKMVDRVKSEEIKATTVYHKLNKENSELLRRYCFYLKLKIIQL